MILIFAQVHTMSLDVSRQIVRKSLLSAFFTGCLRKCSILNLVDKGQSWFDGVEKNKNFVRIVWDKSIPLRFAQQYIVLKINISYFSVRSSDKKVFTKVFSPPFRRKNEGENRYLIEEILFTWKSICMYYVSNGFNEKILF